MKGKKIYIILFLIMLFLSGCVTVKTGSKGSGAANTASNGGVFKTVNKGISWQQKALLQTVAGKPAHIAGLDAAALLIDPSDNKTVYFGSIGSGLFFSLDGGESWQAARGLTKGTIRSIAVDYQNKCVIYAASGNRLLKSPDCTRSWSSVYTDNEAEVTVEAIAVDPQNSKIVYIGLSRGEVIKSLDSGESWMTIFRAKDKIKKIVVSFSDQKIVFAATAKKGIFRTTDGGGNWQEIANNSFKKINIGLQVNELVAVAGTPESLFVATENGLASSTDQGETWAKINTIPPEAKTSTNSLAVNPKNTKEIYYVTNTTFYRSADGGSNWSTIKVPTARAGQILAIDPVEPNVIYMGVKLLKK